MRTSCVVLYLYVRPNSQWFPERYWWGWGGVERAGERGRGERQNPTWMEAYLLIGLNVHSNLLTAD